MSESHTEIVRQLLYKAVQSCPSTNQCLHCDREIIAANSRNTLEAICEALEFFKDDSGTVGGEDSSA